MLTHTDLLSLPASRQLDALVAEKVMGWREVELQQRNFGDGVNDFPGFFGKGVPPDLTIPYRAEIPHYSTSIAAAWEVVEALRARCMWLCRLTNHAMGYVAEFGPDYHRQHIGDADTAALAICRAALKAVGATDAD